MRVSSERLLGDTHQFADILAPDLASGRLLGHEGDAVELREEVVEAFHACAQRQVGAVQAGLDVEPATRGGEGEAASQLLTPRQVKTLHMRRTIRVAHACVSAVNRSRRRETAG